MMRASRSAFLALVLLLSPMTARPESLGDASERVKEQKKSDSSPKVFTNEDLRPEGVDPRPTPRGAPTEVPTPAPALDEPQPSEQERKRQIWSSRAQVVRSAVDKAHGELAAAQEKLDAARSPFHLVTPRGYGNPEIPKLEADVATAQQRSVDAEKALADFGEEARRGGIPPGWIENR
jgi:hypothetical protein